MPGHGTCFGTNVNTVLGHKIGHGARKWALPQEVVLKNGTVPNINKMAAGSGSRWTEAETKALLDAYGEQIIQEAIDGMATNKVVYDEIRKILKEHSNIDRTTSQIESKIKKLRSGYSKLKDRMKQSGSERPYFSSALSSVEKNALKVWEQLDQILDKY